MELQTPQAADMTWKRAGSSPVGLQVSKTSKRQAWKAKPTTEIIKKQALPCFQRAINPN